MLKLTYTETGLHVEHLPESVEDWMAARVVLSVRTAEALQLEPCSASLLLHTHLSGLDVLQTAVKGERAGAIALSLSDLDCVEAVLHGTWVHSNPNSSEGVFLASLSHATELLLVELWQQSQFTISAVGK